MKTFSTDWEGGSPAPRHGWFYDESAERLYVRLHDNNLYGSADPNQQVMAVSPNSGVGFTIDGSGPANVLFSKSKFRSKTGRTASCRMYPSRRCLFLVRTRFSRTVRCFFRAGV